MKPQAREEVAPPAEGAAAQIRDVTLARACCRGDQEAFEQLVRIYQQRIFNLTLRMLADREEAEDAAQETFVRAYAGLGKWREKGPFASWLCQIAVNVCRELARRRARRGNVILSPPEEMEEAGFGGPGVGQQLPSTAPRVDSLEKEEAKRYVHEALSSLPEHYRATLVLFELEGFSYEEIAAMTGAPVGTVRSRLNRARLLFKDRIKKWINLG